MIKRRRLSDLYVRGKEVVLDDGHDDPVKVWLQKLNPVDRETTLRRAQAAKARFMLEADNEDSEYFQSMYAQVRELGEHESLVNLIIAPELAKFKDRVQAELGADEETWGKDGYLQGLVDAWVGDDDNPGLAAAQAEDSDDPDAKRVMDELERFETEVADRVKVELGRLQADFAQTPEEDLWRQAAHRVLEMRGDDVLNKEYERQQLFFTVRDPDQHAKRYFGSLTDIDDLDETVQAWLIRHYSSMMVDSTEGKDSRASQPSSKSSDPSPAVEAQVDSGLAVASG